jgi:hypothetical protein
MRRPLSRTLLFAVSAVSEIANDCRSLATALGRALASGSTTAQDSPDRDRQDRPAGHLPASARWSLVASAGPSRPGRRWCAGYSAAGLNGPQRWSTVRRHDRRGPTESAAGQRFLIGDASLGWNPSAAEGGSDPQIRGLDAGSGRLPPPASGRSTSPAEPCFATERYFATAAHNCSTIRFLLTWGKRKMLTVRMAVAGVLFGTLALGATRLAASAEELPFGGAWAAVNKNLSGAERTACSAVAKFGLARLSGNTAGEIMAFIPGKRLDFGGYADTESVHVSIGRSPDGSYVFRDRWYDDGEGGTREGYKIKTYAVRLLNPARLEIHEGKFRVQYVKCDPSIVAASQAPGSSNPSTGAGVPTQGAAPRQSTSPPTTVANPGVSTLQNADAVKVPEPAASAPSVPTPQVAQESPEAPNSTKFRSLFIGMTRTDIKGLANSEFVAKFENADPKANPCKSPQEASCQLAKSLGLFEQSNKATFSPQGSNKVCAEAIFGKDEKVEQLNFSRCFFGASDLEFQPFAQAIVNNYGINSVSCKSDLDSPLARQYAREGVGPSDPRTCTGLARTGEKVTITTGGFVQPDMTVEKASEKPTFN